MITGRTYIIAFPDTTRNKFDVRFAKTLADSISLFVYSPTTTEVVVTTALNYKRSFTAQGGQVTHYILSGAFPAPIFDLNNLVRDRVFRLDASNPIIVYAFVSSNFGCAAWTPMPVESWGTDYVAAGFEGEVTQNYLGGNEETVFLSPEAAPAELCVIAAYDNTEITVTPGLSQQNDALPDWTGSPRLSVSMSANSVYQLQSFVDTAGSRNGVPQPDIAGVRIHANKPIAVISGNTRAQLNGNEQNGLGRNSFKDLMLEQLAPIDQHGEEFVYTPTMDDRVLTGMPGEKTDEKRTGEKVRVYGVSPGTTRGSLLEGIVGNSATPFTAPQSGTFEHRAATTACVYHTESPAQVYKGCLSVAKYTERTWVGLPAPLYESWGTYMTELVPREQWGSFAPYAAPPYPGGMRHYMNVITDTASRFRIVDQQGALIFGWTTIPGTNLCWATRIITPGGSGFLRGLDENVRFSGFVYGLVKGREEIIPGSTRRKDDARALAHAAEYIDHLGAAYGYPLAPRRAVLSGGIGVSVDTVRTCDSLFATARTTAPNPVGIRTAAIQPGSINARLTLLEGTPGMPGEPRVKVVLTPINPKQDASATLLVLDRGGASQEVLYTYRSERTLEGPSTVAFGAVNGLDSVDRVVPLFNSTASPITVRSIITNGVARIVSSVPTPLIINPGDTFRVTVRIAARGRSDGEISDTLRALLECGRTDVPIAAQITQPCISITGLNFGTLKLGTDSARTLSLRVCNSGTGVLSLSGSDVLRWLDTALFTVSAQTLSRLRNGVQIAPGGCESIPVTFRPRGVGSFSTTAYFNSNAECGADTSLWRAVVEESAGVAWSEVAGEEINVQPLPARDRVEITFTLRRAAPVSLTLIDAGGREVWRSERECGAGAERLNLNVGELPAGVYSCRIAAGGAVRTVMLPVAR